MEIVITCPTSKEEWANAARKKNCSRIATKQKCVPAYEFRYHCVINGYRNKMVEVCAPTRIIFGRPIYVYILPFAKQICHIKKKSNNFFKATFMLLEKNAVSLKNILTTIFSIQYGR